MVQIHEGFIRFLNQDLFHSKDSYDDLSMKASLEGELFSAGLERFNTQLTRHLMKLAQKENISLSPTTNIFYYINKLYLFTIESELILFEFPEESTNLERLDLLISNAQSIKEKGWEHILSSKK